MNQTTKLSSPSARLRRGSPRRHQGGISLLLVLFIGVLLFIVGGAALRSAPTYIEYMAIVKAVERAEAEGGDAGAIRRSFDRAAAIDSISTISGKDLSITEQNGVQKVAFDYEKRVPLAGPVSLVIEYRRGQPEK